MNELEDKLYNLSLKRTDLIKKLNIIKDEFSLLSAEVEPMESWLASLPIENIYDLHKPKHRLLMLSERDVLKKKGLAMVNDLTQVELSIHMTKLDLLIEKTKLAAQ